MSTTAKEEVIAMLGRMSDDVTFDEIAYNVILLKKLKLSQQASERGEVYTNEEVKEYLNKKWGLELK